MSSEFRLGIDIEVNTDDEEISCNHYRVKKIENLEKCKNLRKLSLVASCVEEIANLDMNSQLEQLEIYQGLVKEIQNVSHLTNLKILDLSFNDIRVIQNLESLHNLEKLYLSNNKISEIQGLETLTNLKVLELGSNKIRNINPSALKPLIGLEELWLGKNKISSLEGLESCSFPKLKQISFQSNRLTRWLPQLFSTVAPNLTHLYLGNNQLPDMDLATIDSVSPEILQELDLSCNALTMLPRFSRPMVALEELWLNDNRIGPQETFEKLKIFFPALKTIYVERNPVHSQFPLDCRRMILNNAPESLEQIDATMIPRKDLEIRVAPAPNAARSILRH